MATSTNTCQLGTKLTIRQVVAASRDVKLLELPEGQRRQVVFCRETLDQLNSDEKPVYGVSTGFGHLENQWIPREKQSLLQVNLIRSHAIGTGDEVPQEITRVALILLANSLAKGHSGIRIETLDRIILYLHNDIIPITYTI